LNLKDVPWPLLRQLAGPDKLGRGMAVKSAGSQRLRARTAESDKVVKSICPYCAVGCGQNVYVKDQKVVQIEGDPDSAVSRGRLCPKGSASLQLTTGSSRRYEVLYRPPHAADWERLDLDTAMDMIADRVIETRRQTFEWEHEGQATRRTMGIASLGGATLDNEENYLIKKLLTALGVVQVENQARVCHSSTVAGLGSSFGRGGSTTCMQDLQNSDCIVIEGSNFADAHPVGFQWVMEARARGAKVIHVDPRFSRTSALADLFVPIRAGTDIAFLGGVINYVLTHDKWFREYVVRYTNAPVILSGEFRDTEDLGGLFSGFDEQDRKYDFDTWQYESGPVQAASGSRDEASVEAQEGQNPDHPGPGDGRAGRVRSEHGLTATSSVRGSGHGESYGSGGPAIPSGEPTRDETLQHPRCVFQVLKRHYARYTPDMVEQTCGTPKEVFLEACAAITDNSGQHRTTSFSYAMGWTQHSVGVQNIRAASVLQLLLGNIGRPGGGIMALRGHSSIQGSSDIPTLFNLLPGYLAMPYAEQRQDLDAFIAVDRADKGFWANMKSYLVSLLKAWWGPAATPDNDFCFGYLPRLTGDHSTYQTVLEQLAGRCKGYFVLGENPAVASANAKMQRLGMANLDWLVVRDFSLIESACWWKDGPEIATGELATEAIGTEVFFLPAAAHTEKAGSFTNTNRLLQWRHPAVEPDGDARSDLWFMYHLGRRIREKLAGSTDPADQPVLELTWDYPTEGPLDEPSADAVLAEINGFDASGQPLSAYTQLKDDGSTACGCWIYCGVYADGVNQAARRAPWREQNWLGPEWGWAWPANRRILYNRASADPEGKPWSPDKALVWWDGSTGIWTGHDVADFVPDKPPDYVPPPGSEGPEALAGDDPFIMQADGKGWLFVPSGLVDGPLPAHYEPQESPADNPLYPQRRNPARRVVSHPDNRFSPSGSEPGADVYPYVLTTYRLTEHFTGGGMTRWLPYLAELQPGLFCEVSPELAAERGLEHHGWATIVSARNAIEARVQVTERMEPLTVNGRTVHQVGMPYHWGSNGLTTGDTVNDLTAIALDPNVHIQEDKALLVDIRPGRRPRGGGRVELVREYQRRAGVTADTGLER
jgi:formate dehydrogenase major subunit